MATLRAYAWLFFSLVWSHMITANRSNAKTPMNPATQRKIIYFEAKKCFQRIANTTPAYDNGLFCPATWDNVQCWDRAPAGIIVRQNCPDYVFGFNSKYESTKYCTKNGTWFTNGSKQWTNFTQCYDKSDNLQPVPDFILNHMNELVLMYKVGYGVSLVSLVVAVIVILSLKRLHCQRNSIHLNLFVSYIIRAIMCFLKESLIFQGLAPRGDVIEHKNARFEFIDKGSHWGCKLLYSFIHYSICACVMWIFTEGFYLHAIIYWDKFARHIRTVYLAFFAWGFPVLSVIPYVIARVYLDDTLCWNMHANYPEIYWILRAPLVFFIVVNFVFFINIIRSLYTKLSAGISMEKRKSRKLAKSTLVLIPLFGVEYIIFIAIPDSENERLEFIKMFAEMFCNSFHGFVIALLFCFLNSEVQHEILKKWRRYRLRTRKSFSLTSSPQTRQYRKRGNSSDINADGTRQGDETHSRNIGNAIELTTLMDSPTCRDYDNNLYDVSRVETDQSLQVT